MPEKSQVLALKYRPKSFDKLIGQEAITQTLIQALSAKRLSHAYLFSGLRGSGKTSTARIFSKALVCEKGPTPTPCEVCPNCVMANENRHIDIIEMDAASSRKIDDIRDLIEQTKYRPSIAAFKIFIIDEVHMLTREAFNALLKTLEEPPEYVKFVLATTDPLKLPATILSRTQHFRFKQISRSDIVHHLSHILNQEHIAYEVEALEMLSRAGNGSLRDTLTLLDQAILFSKGHVKPNIVASMLGLLDPDRLEEIFEMVFEEDRKGILDAIKELESHECEVVIDELIAYLKERFLEQDSRFSTLICERFFRILSEAKQLLFINAESGFVLSLVFFKMLEALNIKTIDEMIASLESEKFRPFEAPQVAAAPMPAAPVVSKSGYEQLVEKLFDRDYDLGLCFEKQIRFVSFEEGQLTLASYADEGCRGHLRNASNIIKHFVKEVFGLETTIKITQEKPEALPQNEPEPLTPPTKEIPEEGATQGCVSAPYEENKKELDAKEVLNDPFVQKAQELFSPKKIQIRPKI
ncbi:DNA polymerase III subunit gamma/tau [Sulfurospirillum sp. T05]|uniref:DNA polymerase III subunit gamma/tau n=1 Tax=Sulfurospirillum tamanense TaxID=2813362 RepID=A0ABS2WU12_9BACT|nr:DNA polymerase III subunit gamma/tau [Sulfurospirillum tamanensis]